ncbi:SusC/RagA family TonB-linked outer membrane protein [Alistipes communis]|jgi:TonB-linked SusC/RagA family outer membrane protein|uniref:SusC/RagA family TonB-linked outer membrane protein n=2 Tax=Alistipes TaxID=239759 RepID=UPI001E4DF3F9|nr:TonB-dependent receptor [Alistipes communis]
MKHVLLPPPSKKFAVRGVFTCALACLMMLISSSVFAQSQTISGTVTDATTNSPLAGAAIMVKGTTVGTISDADGSYRIKAKPTDVLVCTFFGYKSQEVTVGNRSAVNFAIAEDNTKIDEVVVVGYGTLKKTQLVGAVENLSGEALEGRTNANITRSLQGQIPGLNIIQTDGKPNHQGSVYVRGNATGYQSRKSGTNGAGTKHSIGQGGSALVLIDGVEGDLTTVNPEDVETISVLKDAASAAVYGARGAFGVILVTTKAAKKDRVTVNYNGSFSINRRTVIWEDHLVSDGLQWAEAFAEFFQGNDRTPQSSGTFPSDVNKEIGFSQAYLDEFRRRKTDPSYEKYGNLYGDLSELGSPTKKTVYYGSTDWVDMYLKDYNFTQTHNITVSGAGERSSFAISGRYYNQDGIYNIGEEDFKSYNLRAKGDVKITKWLTLANNTSIFSRKYHQPFVVSGSMPIWRQIEHRAQPLYPVYNEDGTPTYAAAAMVYEGWSRDEAYQEDNKLDAITTTTLTAEPIKDVLKVSADFTYKAIRSKKDRLSPTQTGYTTAGEPHEYNPNSYKSHWTYDTDYVASNIVATWTPKLGENHNLNVVGGWNIEKTKYRNTYLQRKGILYPSLPSFELMDSSEYSVSDSGYDKSMVGVFGRINYTLLNRYIFEFAARYDGSSLFPTNQQWGFFPSGSIGWRISEEPWMKWSRNWLDNFKIRANVGSLGNASIDPYQFLSLMRTSNSASKSIEKSSILINGEQVPYTSWPTMVPASLTWETVTTYDIGVDFDLLRNRLSGSFDYYWRYTNDMLINGPDYPQVLGETSPKGNFGALKTKGWEASLSWRDSFKVGGKPFNYNVKVSVWDSRTWVKDYYNSDGAIYSYYKGQELGDIWGFRTDGYFLTNEEANNWAVDAFHKNGNNFRAFAGDLKFLDLDGNGKIENGGERPTLDNHGDLDIIGNTTPRYQYGINLGANWNGIGLSVFVQGVGKRDWYPMVESGFFWGMYNRPYGYLPKVHTTDAVIMDYSTENWRVTNPGAYYTRRVTYAANRNVGPLTYENDYYLQDASYWRIKNITIDYTFPQELTRKIRIEKLKIYVSGDNIFTHSPLFKHTDMFDPETIGFGDSDYNDTTGGLGGVGQGYSYPMLKTWTIGLNVTF